MEPSDWINLTSAVVNALLLAATIFGVFIAWHAHSKQTRLQFLADFTKRYQEIVRELPEDVNESDFQLRQDARDEIDKARFERTMRAMRAYFDLCFEEWSLHENGELDPNIWMVWKGGMATAFRKPAFQQAWKRISRPHDTDYGAAFSEFVHTMMAARPLSPPGTP